MFQSQARETGVYMKGMYENEILGEDFWREKLMLD